MRKFLCLIIIQILFIICGFAGEKIRQTILVDGKVREFYIHVPISYNVNNKVPLVFMLHGTNGDGDVMYQGSGWVELAEQEGFIAVFPSSLRYKVVEADGEMKTVDRWNTASDADWDLQQGEVGYDDIKFLRKIVELITTQFSINVSRIYLNGFSNGGQMAAKCSIEMSDILAAVCSNAGTFDKDTVYMPLRKIPYLFQVGNRDYGPGNDGPEFPRVPMMYFDSLISNPDIKFRGGKFYNIKNNVTRDFNLFSQHTGLVGDSNLALFTTYLPTDPNDTHEFRYVFVNELGHSYPNWAPSAHWQWMKKYTLDNTQVGGVVNLNTIEGYGSGQYEKDEVVHIWSKQIDGKVFTHWSGDVQYLESPDEYHTKVTMPSSNVTVTANYVTLLPTMDMYPLTVQGAEKEKKIFVYVPLDKNKLKGIVWFFHGTNGNAGQMTADPDVRQMMNLLMVNNYGVIALTSEESEFKMDFDNDGNYRWSYGIDTNLIDIANVRAIRDSLLSRNLINHNTLHAAIGWSAGGAFTEFIANALHWKAAINHTSSGSDLIASNAIAIVPYLVSINENDNHPDVGPEGNQKARENVLLYKNRGACAILHEHLKAPLYPERFDRSPFINEALSKSIFNEIKNNNGLDEKNYLKLLSGPLSLYIGANPAKFPVIVGLTDEQKSAVLRQIEVTNAEHNIKADINGLTLQFIEQACGNVTYTDEVGHNTSKLSLIPNPATTTIDFDFDKQWGIYDQMGKQVLRGQHHQIDISQLYSGIYIVKSDIGVGKFVKH